MRYRALLEWLYSLSPRGVRLGLGRMRRVLAMRGHPERQLRFVHVAGTNGKGSVCAMLDSVLRKSGYRVGLYTSPHLHRFTERVRIDGEPIEDREAAKRLSQLRLFLEKPGVPRLTFFEVATVLALEAFVDAAVDVVILETGLGGRLDATNVVTPELSVITHIARDHEVWLGKALAAIAYEKAGIIKANVPCVMGEQRPGVRAVLRKQARVMKAPLAESVANDAQGYPVALAGEHQVYNTSIALAALRHLSAHGWTRVTERTIRSGLKATRWPGRLELVPGRPPVLFDAAHNLDGCQALARALADRKRASRGRRVLVFGVMADKDYRGMLRALAPSFNEIIFTRPNLGRAATEAQLMQVIHGVWVTNPEAALAAAKGRAGRSGLVVVAGSIYLLAGLRAAELGLRQDPLIAM